MEEIPVFNPTFGIDTISHLINALDQGWLGMGAITAEFENRIAQYLGLEERTVIAVNTGTAALHLGLLAAGVRPGDEVITPSINYIADYQAIVATGAVPVACDIEERTLGIDCHKAQALITARTTAIIPLHFAGIPCDQRAVYELAQARHLRVIEDCCHAFGTTLDGRKLGSYGDISIFSFDPAKVVTAVDGGAVVVGRPLEAEHVRRMRMLGVDEDPYSRHQNGRAEKYDVICQGFRYHLNNISASIGVAQIKHVDEFIASRRDICRVYNAAFGGIDALTLFDVDFSEISPFIYVVRVGNGQRQALAEHLRGRGIATGSHFFPAHQYRYFSNAGRGDLSVSEKVGREVLTLPLHSHMKSGAVERVVEGVTSFFQ